MHGGGQGGVAYGTGGDNEQLTNSRNAGTI
jgi:hypothetical protein